MTCQHGFIGACAECDGAGQADFCHDKLHMNTLLEEASDPEKERAQLCEAFRTVLALAGGKVAVANQKFERSQAINVVRNYLENEDLL